MHCTKIGCKQKVNITGIDSMKSESNHYRLIKAVCPIHGYITIYPHNWQEHKRVHNEI